MNIYKLIVEDEIINKPKVIFDTNAYRNFKANYLNNLTIEENIEVINKFKVCKKNEFNNSVF